MIFREPHVRHQTPCGQSHACHRIGRVIAIEAALGTIAVITKLGGEAVTNGDDVSDPEGAAAMVRHAVETFGRLDAVVNNAGILGYGVFHKMTYENFDAVGKVHLCGAFNVSRAETDLMRGQGSSNLIHMTSTIKVDSPKQEDRVNELKEMAPEKIAPMALFLAFDAAADTTGQFFACRNVEIFLMSRNRPLRSVPRSAG